MRPLPRQALGSSGGEILIKNLNGGKTFPKRGRLGSGAYWPKGGPIAGNIFGPNTDVQMTPTPPASRPFGSPSNAGNSTQFGQNRATTGQGSTHPNAGFYSISQQPKIPAFVIDGRGRIEIPTGPAQDAQPHERNSLMTRKVFGTYRTASGASSILPSDTAFHSVPVKQNPHPRAAPPVQVVKVQRTSAKIPSFVSRNNIWTDPNGSFTQGKPNINGDIGRGRWATIKRGAAG
jgi:hypothetical protein